MTRPARHVGDTLDMALCRRSNDVSALTDTSPTR